jgi:hypothetical protein
MTHTPPEVPVTVADPSARRRRRPGLAAILAGAGATSGAVSALHSPALPLYLSAAVTLAGLSLVAALALLAILPRRTYRREAAERVLRLLLIDTRTIPSAPGPTEQQRPVESDTTATSNETDVP